MSLISYLCVARALVSTPSEMVPVRVVNTSLTPTTLYKNSKIATTKHIKEHSICTAREDGTASTDDIHNDLLIAQPFPDDITEAQKNNS